MEGYQACGFVVRTVIHLAEALFISHPMPVGIRYWYYGFVHTLCG